MTNVTWREQMIRRLIRSLNGKRVTDGGQRGTLRRCHECNGTGLLHHLDPDELARLSPQPIMGDGPHSGVATAGDLDGEVR